MKIMPLFLSLTLLLGVAPSLAQPGFTENFSTTTYESPSSNSAHWDTDTATAHLYPFEITPKGMADTPGNVARKVAIQGRYAYLADGFSGVMVIDVANPALPQLVGSYNTPGYVYQVHPHGDQLYVADHSGGLRTLDISDPLNPFEIAALVTPEVALGLWVDGDVCYVGCGAAGVVVVSIIDPATPVIISVVDTPGDGARSIQSHGQFVYVADGNGGLAILDVSSPDVPVLTATMEGYDYSRDLVIAGDYLFMSERNFGLTVVDISEPTAPFIVGAHPALGEVRSLDLYRDTLYLANDGEGVQVYDVGLRSQPILRAVIETVGHAYDVLRTGEFLLVADQVPGLQSFEVAHANEPVLVHEFPLTNVTSLPVFAGNKMYLGQDTQLVARDIGDPSNPVLLGSATLSAGASLRALALCGDWALAATGDGDFVVMDITDPASMFVVGQVSLNSGVEGMAVMGRRAILVGWNSLEVVDFSDASAPHVEGGIYSEVAARGVAIQGNLAVTYGVYSDLTMLDLTDPGAPMLIGSVVLDGTARDVEIQGDLVYVATSNQGVDVIDISDPTSPFLVSNWPQDANHGAIACAGNYLYRSGNDEIVRYGNDNATNPVGLYSAFQGAEATHRMVSLTHRGDYLVGLDSRHHGIKFFQITQNTYDLDRRYIASTSITTGTEELVRLRYRTVDQGRALWNVAVNGSGAINGHPQNTWVPVPEPGPELAFDARLGFTPEAETQLDDLTVEWLYHFAQITAVSDVPSDQGRQVRVQWLRSGHDFLDDDQQTTQYAVYRRIDEPGKAGAGDAPLGAGPALLDNIQAMSAAGWDYLTSVPVLLEDLYSVVVPTLADSTGWNGDHDSVFKVVALTATPGIFHTSYPDSGSSVDNLAPGIPLGLTAAPGPTGVDLAWNEAEEQDVQYFNIYRDSLPGFVPGAANLVQQVVVPQWTDEEGGPYYQVTAVDFAGNESPSAHAQFISDAPLISGSPFALHGAVPNPFNPSTRIDFSLDQGGPVQLSIYDVAGRLVRTLVDENLSRGTHHRRWDGRNQAGRQVASGVYFALLRQDDQVGRQRLMLMK